MPNPILSVDSLSLYFGKSATPTLDSIKFQLYENHCTALVGESGSGKTLCALAILQLLPNHCLVDQRSRIQYQNQDLLNFSEKKMRSIRGNQIGMIFQDAMAAFNPVFTIGHQIEEVFHYHSIHPKKECYSRVLSLLSEMGIPQTQRVYHSYPHELSGGQRQRAMIAMALAASPKILIADEPTTALDVTLQKQVIDLLLNLKEKKSISLLFISHDLALVSQLADDIVVLKKGKLIEKNTSQFFFKNPTSQYSQQLIKAIPSLIAQKTADLAKPTLLSIQDLKVYFPIKKGLFKRTIGFVKAVDGISLQLKTGETFALVGESGSGKSTVAKTLVGLVKNHSGALQLNGKNFISSLDIQIIFQDPYTALNPRLLVGDCIAEGLLAQKKAKNRRQAWAIVDEFLERVELPKDSKWRYPHEFSGGQRQRIAIARSLALKPKILILDEPTSALDVSIQKQILELLDQLQQQYQLTYLLITHNIGVVATLAHDMAVMQQGKIIESGTTDHILNNPQEAYTKKLLLSVPSL